MRFLVPLVPLGATLLITAQAPAPVWLNEFHYDNISTDAFEFVEVVVSPDEAAPLSSITVTLYNGSGGTPHETRTLDTFIVGSVVNGYEFYYLDFTPIDPIMNGAPDGISIDIGGSLVQFLSWEGAFVGVGGAAGGAPSSDIGVTQSNTTTPLGSSLGLTGGPGDAYNDFSWAVFNNTGVGTGHTAGGLNWGQTLVPGPGALALLGLAAGLGRRRRRA